VDPFAADCATQAASKPAAFADCCLGTANDPFVSPTIQERAWSSPVWYRPEAIGALRAHLVFGRRTGNDALALRATLGRMPAVLDPVADGLTVRLADDDDVVAIAIPPNGFRKRGRRWVFKDRAAGRRSVVLATKKSGATLTVVVHGADLGRAAREDHTMTLTLESTLFRTVHGRRWLLHGRRLAPES